MAGKMMSVSEYNKMTKALMEENKQKNAGKPPKAAIKPAAYTPKAKPGK